jgi:hypothetical protein
MTTRQRSIQPAFNHAFASRIERTINDLAVKQNRLHQVQFSCEELRQLFIPPTQRRTLTHAYQLQEGGPYGFQQLYVAFSNPVCLPWYKPRMKFQFKWENTSDGFLVPRQGWSSDNPATVLDDAPAELVEKFNDIVLYEVTTSFDWGLVKWVFNMLNNPEHACTTVAQIRYLWPCLVTLLQKSDLDEVARSVAEPSQRAGDRAKAPPYVMEHLKAAYDVVAKVALLEDLPMLDVVAGETGYLLVNPCFEVADTAMGKISFQGLNGVVG